MEPADRTCRKVGRLLPLLVGAELVGADRRRVERHLIGCDRCRERRDSTARALALLELARGQHPLGGATDGGPSLWPALARQIRESRRPATAAGGWSRPRAGGWARLALAAGVLVVGGVGLGLGRIGAQRPAEVAPAAEGRAGDLATAPVGPAPSSNLAVDAPADPLEPFFLGANGLNPWGLGERPAPSGPPAPATLPSRDLALGRPAVDPFQPPATLRLDFDLDQGVVAPPTGRDTQRAY